MLICTVTTKEAKQVSLPHHVPADWPAIKLDPEPGHASPLLQMISSRRITTHNFSLASHSAFPGSCDCALPAPSDIPLGRGITRPEGELSEVGRRRYRRLRRQRYRHLSQTQPLNQTSPQTSARQAPAHPHNDRQFLGVAVSWHYVKSPNIGFAAGTSSQPTKPRSHCLFAGEEILAQSPKFSSKL